MTARTEQALVNVAMLAGRRFIITAKGGAKGRGKFLGTVTVTANRTQRERKLRAAAISLIGNRTPVFQHDIASLHLSPGS